MKAPQSIIQTQGIVVSVTDYAEKDRVLTILTKEMGLISVYARGVRQYKSRQMSASSLFCYGKFSLIEKKSMYNLKEAEIEETFYDLRLSVERAALAGYVCEVICHTGTEQPDEELLRLTLNTLYAISKGLYPLPHIKAAFEFRVASLLGFMPDVTACSHCGTTEGDFVLHIPRGQLICDTCRHGLQERQAAEEEGGAGEIILLTTGILHAIGYTTHTTVDRLFAFRCDEEESHLFYHAAEAYLGWHTDKKFASLDFYHQVAD